MELCDNDALTPCIFLTACMLLLFDYIFRHMIFSLQSTYLARTQSSLHYGLWSWIPYQQLSQQIDKAIWNLISFLRCTTPQRLESLMSCWLMYSTFSIIICMVLYIFDSHFIPFSVGLINLGTFSLLQHFAFALHLECVSQVLEAGS